MTIFNNIGTRSEIDLDKIAGYFLGKTVLVTGAAGSIGSELAAKISNLNPGKLILIDNNETGLYEVDMNLKANCNILCLIADVRDKKRIDKIFDSKKPDIVYHAAAYKHIPLMELHPGEAVKNNLKGTLNVLRSSLENNTKKFVLISSDKAVKPCSMMGATKRICEMLVQSMGKEGYSSVRFGNVLKSRGSVIPLFERQINENKPLTVTHPDMERYFMTIEEACNLILESTILSENGEIFILDMGKPIKIIDVAKNMLKESEKDLEIKFIGQRPGEKLKEELFLDHEKKTRHNKIFIASNNIVHDKNKIINDVEELLVMAENDDATEIKNKIKNMVPSFKKC